MNREEARHYAIVLDMKKIGKLSVYAFCFMYFPETFGMLDALEAVDSAFRDGDLIKIPSDNGFYVIHSDYC